MKALKFGLMACAAIVSVVLCIIALFGVLYWSLVCVSFHSLFCTLSWALAMISLCVTCGLMIYRTIYV